MAVEKGEIITLTKTERQLLLLEVFDRFYGQELETIFSVLPIERRMLQRDVKDLIDAGLISVTFSKEKQAYIKTNQELSFREDTKKPNRTKHLKRLNRQGTLLKKLYNDEISSEEKYDRKKYTSCKDVYEQLFPEASARTRQRDFQTLYRIGYPIKYNRKIQYYEFYEKANNRVEFGVVKEDGQLKRRIGTDDYEEQPIPWDVIEDPEYFEEDNDEWW
jgi:hypothetical protein